jgi:hypothetical protein
VRGKVGNQKPHALLYTKVDMGKGEDGFMKINRIVSWEKNPGNRRYLLFDRNKLFLLFLSTPGVLRNLVTTTIRNLFGIAAAGRKSVNIP